MLKGKTAVVTGASRGIGAAIALRLAKDGANIAILYAGNSEKAQKVAEEAASFGVNAKAYKCNVADYTESESTVKEILKDFKSVDILVNNAGITRDKPMFTMKEDDFDAVVDTNLKGTFNMIKHLYKNFIKNRGGKIINLTSVAGIMGNAGQTNYASSKAGVIGLTKSVAKELAGRNVCCNAIAPGFVETDMTQDFNNDEVIGSIPLGRMAKPEEVAELARFLSDDISNYITGEIIRIDGGLAI